MIMKPLIAIFDRFDLYPKDCGEFRWMRYNDGFGESGVLISGIDPVYAGKVKWLLLKFGGARAVIFMFLLSLALFVGTIIFEVMRNDHVVNKNDLVPVIVLFLTNIVVFGYGVLTDMPRYFEKNYSLLKLGNASKIDLTNNQYEALWAMFIESETADDIEFIRNTYNKLVDEAKQAKLDEYRNRIAKSSDRMSSIYEQTMQGHHVPRHRTFTANVKAM